MDASLLPPSIRVSHHSHQRSRSPTFHPSARSRSPMQQHSPSTPMSILSRGRETSPAPPPLPPPRDVQELALAHEPTAASTSAVDWHWNNPHWQGFASVKPGSGEDFARRRQSGKEQDFTHLEIDPTRRPSSIVTVTPAQGDVQMSEPNNSPGDGQRRPSGLVPGYRYESFLSFIVAEEVFQRSCRCPSCSGRRCRDRLSMLLLVRRDSLCKRRLRIVQGDGVVRCRNGRGCRSIAFEHDLSQYR